MSTPSRFDLSPDELDPPELPPLQTSSIDAVLQQLSEDICRYDPKLGELLFDASFSKKTREEKLTEIREWAKT